MSLDSVGTLLADIANLIHDGLRILGFADKSQWGPDEHEQVRALEEALDDAKKDFQELSQLVNGQYYYQNDRNSYSVDELQTLRAQFSLHVQNFKDWARAGGPINPIWTRETYDLRRLLHRAQCRAAARIFASEHETAERCLGAFLVYRKQRSWRYHSGTGLLHGNVDADEYQRRKREELALCNSIGKFERFGDSDIAFVCDYCDGYIVWEDLETMPSIRAVDEDMAAPGSPVRRTISPVSSPSAGPAPFLLRRTSTAFTIQAAQPPPPPPPGIAHWQATGFTASFSSPSSRRQEKSVVFAPLAIANHLVPEAGQWQSRLLCPFCDDDYVLAQDRRNAETAGVTPSIGDDDEDAVRWTQDERGYQDLGRFQEHLEWQHTPLPVPSIPLPSTSGNCIVM